MFSNKPPDISYTVADAPVPLTPEALKERLYSALVEQQRYTRYDKSEIPGYQDCVRKGGVEINAFVSSRQRLRVDVLVLAYVHKSKDFTHSHLHFYFFL